MKAKKLLEIMESVEVNEGVADVILQQLGGNKFTTMTGARNFISKGNSLSMTLPRGCKYGINFLIITLNSPDTYDIDFGKLRGNDVKTVTRRTDIYADKLQTVFTDVTGLHTHL